MISTIVLATITAVTVTLDFTSDVKQFDRYISANYNKLKTTAEQICWNDADYQDILQENLIKVRQRITKSGWTCTTYSNYDRSIYSFIWRGIQNDYRTKKKREGKRQVFDLDNEALQGDINELLENQDHDSQPYHDSIERFTRALFKYLEKNYDVKKSTLFKTYYMTNHNTYKKLAQQSGFQKKYIADIISKMKKDIKINLPSYIER